MFHQDGFGPFSDSAAVSDGFIFNSSFSDEDSSFESFGDFGDFHGAEEGELTPTISGSWTFASEIETVTAELEKAKQNQFNSSNSSLPNATTSRYTPDVTKF